jgi:Flp pilus assembly protein TadG
MMSPALLQRLRYRTKRRGAALVEAAVVVPVLALFLGLMMFLHAQYSAKLAAMTKARAAAWDNSLHGCNGGESQKGLDEETPGTQDPSVQKVLNESGSGGMRGVMEMAVKKTSSSTNTSTATAGYLGSVSAESHVFCNERNYGESNLFENIFSGVSKFWQGGF